MKLSKRETILIGILVLVLMLSTSLKFIVLPALENINNIKQDIEELKFRKKEMDSVVNKYSDIDDMIENEFLIMNNSDYFYTNIYDTFVDNLIQDYTEAHNIEIISITFGKPDEPELTPDINGIKEFLNNIIRQKLKINNSDYILSQEVMAKETLAQQPKTQEVKMEEEILPVYRCNLSLTGKTDDVINMINSIYESDKSIIVTGLEGSISQEIFSGSLTIDIYYII